MKKNFAPIMALTLLLIFAGIAAVPAQAQIRVFLNNNPLQFDVPPVLYQGRTLVPLRGIFESMGASVVYNAPTRSISAQRGSTSVQLTLDSRTAFVNGQPVTLDVPAMSVSGRTMVPLRFISESFGADVRWNAATQTVTIIEGAQPQPTPTATQAPGQNVVQGIVTAVRTGAYPQTITIARGNAQFTYEVTSQTVIWQTETSGNTSNAGTLSRIFPGDDATITTATADDNRAQRIETRYREIRGTVSGRAAGRVILDDGSVITVHPNARILLNNRQVGFNTISTGQQAQFRINPTTNEAWRIVLTGAGTGGTTGTPVTITSFTSTPNRTLRPGDTIRFMLQGTPGGAAYFTIPGVIVRRPMQEVASGQYEGSYTVTNNDISVNATAVGTLEAPGMRSGSIRTPRPVVIQVDGRGRPGRGRNYNLAPTITSPRPNNAVNAPFTISGVAGANATVVIRVEPTANLGPIGAELGAVENRVQADARGNFSSTFNFLIKPSGLIYNIRAYQINPNTGANSPETVFQVRQQ